MDNSNMKKVFKNNDISNFSSSNKNNIVYRGPFYVSGNSNRNISDVIVNFFVKKIYFLSKFF